MTEPATLTEVYCGPDPVVDVVAVHGLNGDGFKTWTTKKTKKFWLGDVDMLPANLKNARILTFNYNATVAALFGKTSSDTILQHAQTLVGQLVADRELEDATKRPIIFICHSLGGIIVKRALAYSASRTSHHVSSVHSIYVSTFAILFLGTPHNGSSQAALACTVRRIASTVLPSKVLDTDGQLVEALRHGSETLQNITDMFVPLMRRFRVYFFWEQVKMDLGYKRECIVEQSSAAPAVADTERAGLPYDHSSMCKFESRAAPGYRVVAGALVRYTKEAPDVIAKRWIATEEMQRTMRMNEAAELQAGLV